MGTRAYPRRKARVKQRRHIVSGIDWGKVRRMKVGEVANFALPVTANKVMPSVRTYASRVAAKQGFRLSVHFVTDKNRWHASGAYRDAEVVLIRRMK